MTSSSETNQIQRERNGATVVAAPAARVELLSVANVDENAFENYRGTFEKLTPKEQEELKQLAKSIEAAGLIHPIAAIQLEGAKVGLAAGWRRFFAVKHLLKWRQVMVNLYPAGTDVLAVQTAENTGRKDVNACRLAKRLALMVEGDEARGIPPAAKGFVEACNVVGGTVSLSGSSVKNMVRVATKASPTVLSAWEKHGNELPLRLLIEWCVLPHEEQDKLLEAYITRRRVDLRGEKEGEGGKGKRGKKGKHGHAKRSVAEIKEKYEALAAREDETSKIRAKTLAWVLGERETV